MITSQMVRVCREANRWVVIETDDSYVIHHFAKLVDMPEPLRSNLAVLNAAAEPINIPEMGRRISAEVFWVYSGVRE